MLSLLSDHRIALFKDRLSIAKQRITALFLIVILVFFGTATFPSVVLAASKPSSSSDNSPNLNPHKTPSSPAINPKDFQQPKLNISSPPVPVTQQSKQVAAADVTHPVNGSAAAFFAAVNSKVSNSPIVPSSKNQTFEPHELINKRTAISTEYLNKNGSITKTNYFSPHFYRSNGQWQKIDTTLKTDSNAADSSNIFGKALGAVESWVSSPHDYIEKANNWQARFAPSNFSKGMVRIKEGSSQIGFSPINANSVAPVITTSHGHQTVHYYNLWPNVDVDYMVESDQVKESIILKDKSAANNIQFKIIGATLKTPNEPSTAKSVQPAFNIQGALNNAFNITPSNLILNNFGYIDNNTSGLTQNYKDGILTVGVDNKYLQSLSDKAFPAVIDPSVYTSTFGTRAGGNYVSFETNGTTCYSNVCDLYAGDLYDSNYNLQYWDGAFFAPYSMFQSNGVTLTGADLHLTQLTGVSWWTGTTATHNFQVGHATCLNSYNCVDGTWDSGNIGTSGDIDVTNLYQNRIAAGDWGAWLMVMGQDGTTSSFKSLNPDYSYVNFTYYYNLSSPSFSTPTNNQVFVDPQASFTANPESNPNDSTPLEYEMMISDGPSGTGTVIDSGLQNSTQWTVPDGVLEDGSTYYIQTRSYDSSLGIYSPWSGAVQFKIDSREGNDKTQTPESFGPATVDLATGNVSTSITSHTTQALGGTIGVNLSYNSPLKSRSGLVGQYWNLPANTWSIPSTAANLTRVDQNINFNWQSGSPQSGNINSTWFATRWSGYFVAPTTGSYTFGGTYDDSMNVYINNSWVAGSGGCSGSAPCYTNSVPVSLTAGQVVPIRVEYEQATATDYVSLYVKGAVSEQVVPESWLQTGVRPVQQNNGLIGHYYSYADTGVPPTIPTNGSGLFLTRTDPLISFNWGSGSPIPNGPSNDFMVRWTGYITAPVTGSYTFGTLSDDGSVVTVNNQQVYSAWQDQAATTPGFGSAITLAAGQSVPITVDYYQHLGADQMSLMVQAPGTSSSQVVPTSWLSPEAQVLPAGWGLGLDPGGSVSYERLIANQNNVILTDSSGDTHDYTWTGSGYSPPDNEYGHLVRNLDGTFTLQDSDGRTYVFDSSGTLTSVTNPVDDQKPAALQYSYGSVYSGGPVELQRITDPVNTNRFMAIYYSGASQCGSIPTGFGLTPANMLCAAQTNDGRTTYFYYDTNGNLARIAEPGGEYTDYQYQSVLDSNNNVIGYQLIGIRSPLADDVLGAGVRANDESVYTQISYDALGRAIGVIDPAATQGATQMENTVEYLPGAIGYQNGNPTTGYFGATQVHVTGATEPVGYTERVEYDNLFRTTKQYNVEGLATTIQWDTAKDLEYSTTTADGQMSSTIYDDNDRATTQYGPAPSSWFTSTVNSTTGHTDITPLSAYASQVPRTDASYDQGMAGLAVSYMSVNEPSADRASLFGAPLLHSTNIATDGTVSHDFGTNTSPIPNVTNNWGFSMTGTVRFPTSGNWTFNITSDEGVRMWVDNKLEIDDWKDNSTTTSPTSSQLVSHPSYTINNTANALHTIRIDYYHLSGDANFTLYLTPPGGSESSVGVANYFSPDYSLITSSTTYDSTLGNSTEQINYGSNPSLGLPTSTTNDLSGLALTTTSGYESPGSGYMRQTSTTLPGGNTYYYQYYGANDTATNPCSTSTNTYMQAGLMEYNIQPNPGNGGSSLITQYIYDDAGRVIATKISGDSQWHCSFYDDRGRVVYTWVPAFGGKPAYAVTYNYAVNGNPLVTSEEDNYGTITTTTDLLGRVTSYTDTFGDTTNYSYDSLGHLQSEMSPMGTISYTYNNYGQVTDEQFNGVDYAHPYYDQYGRLDHVNYPQANSLSLSSISRDSLDRTNGYTWTLGSGTTTVSDNVNLSQSGKVTNDSVSSGSSTSTWNYTYDTSGRLTGATLGSNSYSYGYGPESSSCASGTNLNAGLNGNRTSYTYNGATTNYCYNYADQLVSSTDPTADAPQYDNHGNMTSIGSGNDTLNLKYDSADRLYGLEQYNSSGNGHALYYDEDASNRIVGRYPESITNGNWADTGNDTFYDYTSPGDTSPSYARNSSQQITEEYLSLPGGVTVTIRPQQTGNSNAVYSLPNTHGDIMLTTDASGTNTSQGSGPASSMQYDPFGNPLASNTLPNNTSDSSYAWLGEYQKLEETSFTQIVIPMGARPYLPSLGRFAQVDPIEGGTANAYAYALDPINFSDLTGMCILQCALGASFLQPAAPVMFYQAAVSVSGAQVLASLTVYARRPTIHIVIKPVQTPAPIQVRHGTALAPLPVVAASIMSGSMPQAGGFAPADPTENPWPGVGVWRGSGPVGSVQGSWVNPDTTESLHPDLNHGPPFGPHYDWRYGGMAPGEKIRISPEDPLPTIPEETDVFEIPDIML